MTHLYVINVSHANETRDTSLGQPLYSLTIPLRLTINVYYLNELINFVLYESFMLRKTVSERLLN